MSAHQRGIPVGIRFRHLEAHMVLVNVETWGHVSGPIVMAHMPWQSLDMA